MRAFFKTVFILFGVLLYFFHLELNAEMNAELLEKILGRAVETPKETRNKKSNVVDPELSFSASYHQESGKLTLLGKNYNLHGLNTGRIDAGVYFNNLLRESTTGRIYDFDVGVFLFYQSKTLSSVLFKSGNVSKGEVLKTEGVYKSSILSSQGLDAKFRMMGSDSQDFEMTLKLHVEFNLEKLAYTNAQGDEDYYLEKYSAYGPGAELTLYFLPFIGVTGHFNYLYSLPAYGGDNALLKSSFSGTKPTITQYYTYKGEAFIEFANIRLYGGQHYRYKILKNHQFHFSNVTISSYYGGLSLFFHL